MAVTTPRRYYLLERRRALALGEPHLAGLWRAKQEALAWPALPADFPARAALVAAGYAAVRDLDGATTAELTDLGLSTRDAAAVLAAMESWPPMIAHTLLTYQRQNGAFAAVYGAPLVPAAAYSATFTSDTYEMGAQATLRLLLDVTLASGSSPTLNCLVQTSRDGVNDWRNLLQFAQKTTTGQSERQCVGGADRFVRVVCTLAGSTPSFTFSIDGEAC